MYYIVKFNGNLQINMYRTLEIAQADRNVELLHWNGYKDYNSANEHLNYFLNNKELNELQISSA